jgi:hypothetical protein
MCMPHTVVIYVLGCGHSISFVGLTSLSCRPYVDWEVGVKSRVVLCWRLNRRFGGMLMGLADKVTIVKVNSTLVQALR